MQRLLAIIALILAGGTLMAQRISMLSGMVKNAEGQPIEGALVTEIDPSGRTIGSAVTDGGGLFNLSIRNSAKNRLQVMADGYRQLRTEITRRTMRITLQSAVASEMPPAGEAVDLGLNIKWADRNVGASSPTDVGGFYSWGEVTTKDNYYWTDRTNFGDDIIDTEYDAAHVYWRKRWTMPSRYDIAELVERCVWTWTKKDGVNGYLVTGPSGNSIFLPAGGEFVSDKIVGEGDQGNYWSGSFFENKEDSAYALEFTFSASRLYHGHRLRAHGMMIRPVWR